MHLLVLWHFHLTWFIYLFSGSCSWWDIFGHSGEEAETDDLSCCTLLIRTIPSDLHLHSFNFAFESWINKHFLYLISHCSLMLWRNSMLALSFFSFPKNPVCLAFVAIQPVEPCLAVPMTTPWNINQFCHSTMGANRQAFNCFKNHPYCTSYFY